MQSGLSFTFITSFQPDSTISGRMLQEIISPSGLRAHSSAGEQLPHKQSVAGSNPAGPITDAQLYATSTTSLSYDFRRRDSMNIINIIHIGEETYRMDELPEERRREIWQKLNQQALEAVGYRKVEATA